MRVPSSIRAVLACWLFLQPLLPAVLGAAEELDTFSGLGEGSSSSTSTSNSGKTNQRHLDADDQEGLRACVDAFVVHSDKIIRTKDSRELGAKYLAEFDVDAKSECMRLCCLTDRCDVFVFEERKPSSCYLFQCGPPQDFKCKFTSHANYSSAVLTNYYRLQNSAALEEEIRRTQQEHELKSLRKSDPQPEEYNLLKNSLSSSTTTSTTASIPRTTTSANTIQPTSSTTTTTTTTTQASPKLIPACSRNQFECRSNGECIAIYNVCDGIPQCADGSDEAAELTCPTEKSVDSQSRSSQVAPAVPVVPNPQNQHPPSIKQSAPPILEDVLRYQQMIHNPYQMGYPSQIGKVNQEAIDQQTGFAKPWAGSAAINPLMQYGPRDAGGYRGYPSPEESPVLMNQYPLGYNKPPGYPWGYQIPFDQSKNGLEAIPPQGIPNIYDQDAPHIYKHKPIIHTDDIEASGKSGLYGPDPKQGYAPFYPPVHRPDTWQQQQQPQQPQPSQQQLEGNFPQIPQKLHEASMSVTENVSKSHQNKGLDQLTDAVASKPENTKSSKYESKAEAEVKVLKSENLKEDHSDSHVHPRVQEKERLAVSEHIRGHNLKLEDYDSFKPKGAVVSLVLGVSITAVMAIIISCRLRVVKRRCRLRDRDSYAHDADYLVNGMYL